MRFWVNFLTKMRNPKQAHLNVEDVFSTTIPLTKSTTARRSTLIELYQRYDFLIDKNTRKPYMSKQAREFIRHFGDWDGFNQYQDEILHVDFTHEEVKIFKQYQGVPGRSTEDCVRFCQDYPKMI